MVEPCSTALKKTIFFYIWYGLRIAQTSFMFSIVQLLNFFLVAASSITDCTLILFEQKRLKAQYSVNQLKPEGGIYSMIMIFIPSYSYTIASSLQEYYYNISSSYLHTSLLLTQATTVTTTCILIYNINIISLQKLVGHVNL